MPFQFTEALGIIRHVLTFGGGLAIAFGWATADQVASGSEAAVAAIGAVATLIGVAWSIYNAWQARRNMMPDEVQRVMTESLQTTGEPAMAFGPGGPAIKRRINMGSYWIVFDGTRWTRERK